MRKYKANQRIKECRSAFSSPNKGTAAYPFDRLLYRGTALTNEH
jgi:hypothetical protein